MKNLKMFCPVYGIPIQKCVTFARRLGPVFTAILSALALAEKSPGHICTHLPKGVAPPSESIYKKVYIKRPKIKKIFLYNLTKLTNFIRKYYESFI